MVTKTQQPEKTLEQRRLDCVNAMVKAMQEHLPPKTCGMEAAAVAGAAVTIYTGTLFDVKVPAR